MEVSIAQKCNFFTVDKECVFDATAFDYNDKAFQSIVKNLLLQQKEKVR